MVIPSTVNAVDKCHAIHQDAPKERRHWKGHHRLRPVHQLQHFTAIQDVRRMVVQTQRTLNQQNAQVTISAVDEVARMRELVRRQSAARRRPPASVRRRSRRESSPSAAFATLAGTE